MNSNIVDNISVSKTLSWLLRHSAIKEGLTINEEGFIKVDELLKHSKLNKCSISDILRIAEHNDKQRFTLQLDDNEQWWIRANQGHSIKVNRIFYLKMCCVSKSFNFAYKVIKIVG